MALGGGGIKIPPVVTDPKKDKTKKRSLFKSKTQTILENKWTLKFIMLTPFILLLVSGVSCFLPNSLSLFTGLSNIFGFSIITNLYFLFYAYRHKFCMYSKISIYTLMLLNILNITNLIFDLGILYDLYDQIIAFAGIVLAGIFAIKEIK